jgi:hypothetical protein
MHGTTSQKTAFFIVAAVKNTNPTQDHKMITVKGMLLSVFQCPLLPKEFL